MIASAVETKLWIPGIDKRSPAHRAVKVNSTFAERDSRADEVIE